MTFVTECQQSVWYLLISGIGNWFLANADLNENVFSSSRNPIIEFGGRQRKRGLRWGKGEEGERGGEREKERGGNNVAECQSQIRGGNRKRKRNGYRERLQNGYWVMKLKERRERTKKIEGKKRKKKKCR